MTAAPLPTSQAPTSQDVLSLLAGVVDPELGCDIVELGMARDAVVDPDGTVRVTIALTTAGCPLKAQIKRDVTARLESTPGVTKVSIDWTEMDDEQRAHAMARARWHAKERAPDTEIPATARVVGIASGKGGVGKSSVTVNLAAGLAREGFTVGVLDADIGGFSVPRMLGIEGRLGGVKGEKKIVPHELVVGTGLLKVVSMGFLVEDEGSALLWRGQVLLLGQIPLEPGVSTGGDTGSPASLGTGPAADAFAALVRRIVDEAIPPVAMGGCTARILENVEAALGPMPSPADA